VLLTKLPEANRQTEARFNWAGLAGLDLRPADDGWHASWRGGGVDHQFWFAEPPHAAAGYAVLLPFDALFELRVHAARRFWRALWGKSPGPPFRALPAITRERHILILRALDARLSGASYRTIAEGLLGFRGKTKNDWEEDSRKNQVRRLVADGLRLMRGGYRNLLRYPLRLPPRHSHR
jgi:hypothetical protein